MVPTYRVSCLLLKELRHGEKVFNVGDIVSLPYGLALQAKVNGIVGAISNEEIAHVEAAQHLAQYGGDSWFPTRSQTLHKFGAAILQECAGSA